MVFDLESFGGVFEKRPDLKVIFVMLILVINCGSSSIKYELFDMAKEKPVARGSVTRIGEMGSSLVFEAENKDRIDRKVVCPGHHRAVEFMRDVLMDPDAGILKDVSEVSGVGHRVVHGGEEFTSSILVDGEVIDGIRRFSELAPLHNPPALEGIRGCEQIFKNVPQVAVFDTAFHQTMPRKAFFYGLPYELYEKYGLRKYGFHGTSHRYVAGKAAEILGRSLSELNLITAHLGNGCSMAAVRGGKSVDTSMGFTPLEGLVMGTRCGDIDPAVVAYLMSKEMLGDGELSEILNKRSGLLGLSGISNDMRDILDARRRGEQRAVLAFDVFVHRVVKYAGAYSAVLKNVDAIVFTGGIGENVPEVRDSVEESLAGLLGKEARFLTVQTDEELLIARDTCKVVLEKQKTK